MSRLIPPLRSVQDNAYDGWRGNRWPTTELSIASIDRGRTTVIRGLPLTMIGLAVLGGLLAAPAAANSTQYMSATFAEPIHPSISGVPGSQTFLAGPGS